MPDLFEGHGGYGAHHSTGGRAWCGDCHEWCYPDEPCGQVRCCTAKEHEKPARNPCFNCQHDWDEHMMADYEPVMRGGGFHCLTEGCECEGAWTVKTEGLQRERHDMDSILERHDY